MNDPTDFSFALGGPLVQLLRRVRLTDDDLTRRRRHMVVIALFCWLPLLALSALQRRSLQGGV